MIWLTHFWERFAIRILIKSNNITMVAFKLREADEVFVAADFTDHEAFEFFVRNKPVSLDKDSDPDSMILERLYHAPDAQKGD